MSDRPRRQSIWPNWLGALFRRPTKGETLAALEVRFGAFGNEAQDLIVRACDTFASAGASWESKDYASFMNLMREAAEAHHLVAELYETMARECQRATEKPS